MDTADFERCSLWPIRIDLPIGGGYTLWGSGGGEQDLLLASPSARGGTRMLLLFARWPLLGSFVASESSCNLSATAGFGALAGAWRAADPGPSRLPVKRFSFVKVRQWMERARWDWPRGDCATVLDALNLLWDTARTIDDRDAASALRGDAPLAHLADALTFLGEGERRSVLASQPHREIREAYAQALERITRRCRIIGAMGDGP